MRANSQTEELRRAVQQLIRCMGLLQVRQTPCGQPLSAPQAHTLVFLANRPNQEEPPTQLVLVDYLRLNKSTVTRLLQQLKRRGFVRIEHCTSDRRAKRVHLTEQGRHMAASVDRTSLELFGQVLSIIPAEDREGVIHALEQFTGAIQERQLGESE
jgi:DNA-binding MarR family transcriptional regulator